MSAILRAYLDRVIANMTIRANPVPPAFVNRPRVEIDLGPPTPPTWPPNARHPHRPRRADVSESVEVTTRPENTAELADLIESLTVFDHTDGGDGYNKSADALWQAALAAFEYVARRCGVTGFQTSWSAMKFYEQAMNVRGPFMVIRIEDALYPQYDLPGRLHNAIEEQRPWLAEQAAAKLAELEAEPEREAYVSPRVKAHWRALAAEQPSADHGDGSGAGGGAEGEGAA